MRLRTGRAVPTGRRRRVLISIAEPPRRRCSHPAFPGGDIPARSGSAGRPHHLSCGARRPRRHRPERGRLQSSGVGWARRGGAAQGGGGEGKPPSRAGSGFVSIAWGGGGCGLRVLRCCAELRAVWRLLAALSVPVPPGLGEVRGVAWSSA